MLNGRGCLGRWVANAIVPVGAAFASASFAVAQPVCPTLCCNGERLRPGASVEICCAQELLYRAIDDAAAPSGDQCPREIDGFWGERTNAALSLILNRLPDSDIRSSPVSQRPEAAEASPSTGLEPAGPAVPVPLHATDRGETLTAAEVTPGSASIPSLETGSTGMGYAPFAWMAGALAVAIVAFAVALFRSRVHVPPGMIGVIWKTVAFPPSRRRVGSGTIAARGEPGHQAETLGPGLHWGYWPWMYRVELRPIVRVLPGEIGLVVAKDGIPPDQGRVLCDYVECDNFQDGRAFLLKGGQKGRQARILRAGEYRINPELFDVVLRSHLPLDLDDKALRVQRIQADEIGIVTVFDGKPLPAGEVAAPIVEGHANFQDSQRFIEAGGCKGLQQEYLPAGEYFLNPWFVSVERVPQTQVGPGTVGVVNAHVGSADRSGSIDGLAEPGFRGVQKQPLSPGIYPINTRTHTVHRVPGHEIRLNWSHGEKPASNYDADLRPLKLVSRDGFDFTVEVTQILKILPEDAPKLISRIGASSSENVLEVDGQHKYASIRGLVARVLEPMVSGYFRNAAQDYDVIDFQIRRDEIARAAAQEIKMALQRDGVQALGTFLGEISMPQEVQDVLQQQQLEKMRTGLARVQQELELEKKELQIRVAQTEMMAALERANHQLQIYKIDAEKVNIDNQQFIDKLKLEIEAIGGPDAYLDFQKLKEIVKVRLPEVFVNSGGGEQRDHMIDVFFLNHLRQLRSRPNSADEFIDYMKSAEIGQEGKRPTSDNDHFEGGNGAGTSPS